MNPLKKKAKLEKDHQEELRKFMRALGWHTEKAHGSLFQKGWPDLFCMHVKHGVRWVEMKRPGQGELELSQVKLFRQWSSHGVGVWVLTTVADYSKLFQPPNWHWWLDPELRRLL
jgi:hypothetical protein